MNAASATRNGNERAYGRSTPSGPVSCARRGRVVNTRRAARADGPRHNLTGDYLKNAFAQSTTTTTTAGALRAGAGAPTAPTACTRSQEVKLVDILRNREAESTRRGESARVLPLRRSNPCRCAGW